jgi:hypothetical protein
VVAFVNIQHVKLYLILRYHLLPFLHQPFSQASLHIFVQQCLITLRTPHGFDELIIDLAEVVSVLLQAGVEREPVDKDVLPLRPVAPQLVVYSRDEQTPSTIRPPISYEGIELVALEVLGGAKE